ncbi:MAG: Polyisoprenoid-binding protein YceI [Mucilaginibacter sp.]|nr:Polyisoprenoid-binding protein YceI [Mucilaginibacter sp.]
MIKTSLLFSVLVLLLLKTNQPAHPEPAPLIFKLMNKESLFIWKGTNVLGQGHNGTIQFTSGSLTLSKEGKIQTGTFNIDMTSITSTYQSLLKSRNGLDEHLKSTDFFSVAKFPNATMSIKKVVPGNKLSQFNVRGDLVLKGISKPVNFAAVIIQTKGKIKANAEFSINRTDWGIYYKSGWLFPLIKNDLISDSIKVSLNLLFSKSQD